MNFGYPGENVHLENHGVSEESFWPSFTDIMMVIVMVFLLVTVAVILNNWSLIADLKNSISAQQIASSLAENRQEKNMILESRLTFLEKQLEMLNSKYEGEKKALLDTKQQLSVKETSLSSLEKKLDELSLKLENKEILLVNTKKELSKSNIINAEKVAAIASLQADIENITSQKNTLEALTANQKEKIEEALKLKLALLQNIEDGITKIAVLEKELDLRQSTIVTLQDKQKIKVSEAAQLQAILDETLKEKEDLTIVNTTQKDTIRREVNMSKGLQKELENQNLMLVASQTKEKQKSDKINQLTERLRKESLTLADLQANLNKTKQNLVSLQSEYDEAQDDLKNEALTTKEALAELQAIKKAQLEKNKKLSSVTQALREAESEKQRIIVAMNDKIIESGKKRDQLEATLLDVKEKLTKSDELKAQGHSQLLSLQGEYNTLDAKYQKLLRPARSSKGKYVVSVSYRKRGKNRQIKIKTSPNGSYKSVGKAELHKLLSSLKKKYKDDLYLKIIIPAKSGLSYNEAWKFTNELQKKYDYYQ